MAGGRVEDSNYFWCLLCGVQANANPDKARAGAYGVEDGPDGKARFMGICAFCKGLHTAHVKRRGLGDYGMAMELRELVDLVRRQRRRGMSDDVARRMAVEQQVRAEDIFHVEFMEWLHKSGRL